MRIGFTHVLMFIGIVLSLSLFVAGLLFLQHGYDVRKNKVIILSFSDDVFDLFHGYNNVSVYLLDGESIKYEYRADIIVIISHTAILDNNHMLIALSEPPDENTLYGINVSGRIYKAILLDELASKIHARKVALIGCNITRETVYDAFKGRTEELYYYKCPALPGLLENDLMRIVADKPPRDKCFGHINYQIISGSS